MIVFVLAFKESSKTAQKLFCLHNHQYLATFLNSLYWNCGKDINIDYNYGTTSFDFFKFGTIKGRIFKHRYPVKIMLDIVVFGSPRDGFYTICIRTIRDLASSSINDRNAIKKTCTEIITAYSTTSRLAVIALAFGVKKTAVWPLFNMP